MAIKNYTTGIKVEKTIAEIEQKLAQNGATHIYKIYENGIPKGLAFSILVNGSPLSFKLPMREDKILIVFKNSVKRKELPQRYAKDLEQARRTGWRILKDWIESQLALIEIDIAKAEEIFLPYLYDMATDETFFEKVERKGFSGLLEDNSN